MTALYFTSDLHLGHALVAGLRGFADVESHDEAIYQGWVETVKPDDVVWVLGDVTLRNPHGYVGGRLRELPGRKRLILGNHDRAHPQHRDAAKYAKAYAQTFEYVSTSQRIRLSGQEFLLSHFPYSGDSGPEERYAQWRLPDLGVPLIHGHTHSAWKSTQTMTSSQTIQIHVGLDAWGLKPVSDAQVLDQFKYEEYLREQENCEHAFERVGYNPEYGQLYECTKCGGQSP